MGVAPVVSYNYGSGNYPQLKRICAICFTVIAALSAMVFGATYTEGEALVHVFTPHGTAVYAIATEGFRTFRFSFLLCGFNIFASALFTALSNGLVSAIISFSRTFLFLMAGLLLLPMFIDVTGVWIAVPLAELGAFIVSIVFLAKYRVRYRYF